MEIALNNLAKEMPVLDLALNLKVRIPQSNFSFSQLSSLISCTAWKIFRIQVQHTSAKMI